MADATRTQRSDAATSYRHLYKSRRWQRLREIALTRDKWICQQTGVPLREGRTHPNSAVVHHKRPHRGDPALFYNIDNLESVAKHWHDRQAQSDERRGYANDVDSDGWPTDPQHPVNKDRR